MRLNTRQNKKQRSKRNAIHLSNLKENAFKSIHLYLIKRPQVGRDLTWFQRPVSHIFINSKLVMLNDLIRANCHSQDMLFECLRDCIPFVETTAYNPVLHTLHMCIHIYKRILHTLVYKYTCMKVCIYVCMYLCMDTSTSQKC